MLHVEQTPQLWPLAMSYDPSHRTTLPSFTGTTSDAVSPALGTTNPTRANVSSAPEPTLASTPNNKKRRSSKKKNNKQLSRSASTPQMRDEVMSDSDIEKKRNKLGYQRISIACGKLTSCRAICDMSSYAGRGRRLTFEVLTSASSLSAAQDTMPRCRGRHTIAMPKLHTTEKGMCILSSGSTERDGKQPRGFCQSRHWLRPFLCGIIVTTNTWRRVRTTA